MGTMTGAGIVAQLMLAVLALLMLAALVGVMILIVWLTRRRPSQAVPPPDTAPVGQQQAPPGPANPAP